MPDANDVNDVRTSLAHFIREHRNINGLSQEALSFDLKISERTIRSYEKLDSNNGVTEFLETMESIAALRNLSLKELLMTLAQNKSVVPENASVETDHVLIPMAIDAVIIDDMPYARDQR